MRAAILALFVLVWPYQVLGRDVGQWAAIKNPPEISEWYKSLMRPNFGYWMSSCCAEADAYWCDEIHVRGKHTFCAITDTRDDGPLHRTHRPVGELHEIPADRMKFNPDDPQKNLGNPTGHSIIFLSSSEGSDAITYCFVPNGGV